MNTVSSNIPIHILAFYKMRADDLLISAFELVYDIHNYISASARISKGQGFKEKGKKGQFASYKEKLKKWTTFRVNKMFFHKF
jgi:hypothetical protein